jgi:glycine/D-amino acid oxidase-like deaminating enzyme
VGGFRDKASDLEHTAEEGTTPLIQGYLGRFAAELAGAEPRFTHRWSGIFGATKDRLPLAGRWPGRDDLWVACGYAGHGNVLGLACGELVAEAMLARPPPELELFDPGRLPR